MFEDLVRVSDVVYSNLRGDVPAKIGITYDDLKHVNPQNRLLLADRFRDDRPAQRRAGLRLRAAGHRRLDGHHRRADGPPTKSGLSLVDYSGGLVAAISILAGVHAARRDGVGMDCDVSLFDTAISMLTYPAIWNLNGDFEPKRTHHSAHPSLVPFQAFQAERRLDRRRLPEREVLAAACRTLSAGRSLPPTNVSRRSPTAVRNADELLADPRCDLRVPHDAGMARRAPRRGCALRAGELGLAGPCRRAHFRPGHGCRDRASAIRHRTPGSQPSAGG